MTVIRHSLLFALLVSGVAACEKQDPVADEANAIAPVSNSTEGPAAGGPPPAATTDQPGDAAAIIPAALQGRWGLTPADCEPNRSDNKGLLTISGADLKFYESRATPGTSIETGPRGISGNFNFVGEGQQWSQYISLKLNGDVLTRTERNPVASYNYARC